MVPKYIEYVELIHSVFKNVVYRKIYIDWLGTWLQISEKTYQLTQRTKILAYF